MNTIFQFTPLREGRPSSGHRPAERRKFQFTPLREGRRKRGSTPQASRNFNSRPSARGDGDLCKALDVARISIHAPPRGATASPRLPRRPAHHFNSRPSARGDPDIPAPSPQAWLFQFTPLREGRREGHHRYAYSPLNFNSRPSARGDRAAAARRRPRHISIHAPPRGATARQNVGDCIRVFQFTPLREGRQEEKNDNAGKDDFNSRPSARGDALGSALGKPPTYFNSRPSARGDHKPRHHNWEG